jgi:hypothetical protein
MCFDFMMRWSGVGWFGMEADGGICGGQAGRDQGGGDGEGVTGDEVVDCGKNYLLMQIIQTKIARAPCTFLIRFVGESVCLLVWPR